MRRITQTECYMEILKLAAHDIDNERLLNIVTSLAFHAADYCGPDVVLLLNHIKYATDDRGLIDRRDPEMWNSICRTAGEIVRAILERERKERTRPCDDAYVEIQRKDGNRL